MEMSVVTPVYNDPRVERAIRSVREQSFDGDVERIIVDGDSTDETTEVLDHYKEDIDILIQEPDEGIYDAMNKGVQAATGEVVGILNADDRWEDRHVLRHLAEQIRDSEIDAIYGDKALVDEQDRVIRYWKAGSEASWKWYIGWMPPHPTFFVRRQVYEEYGTFDKSFRIAADYELMLRFIQKHDITTKYLPRVLTRFQLGGKSNASLSNIIAANREVRRAWKKNGLRGGLLAPVMKPGRKVFQYLRALPHRHDRPGQTEEEPI